MGGWLLSLQKAQKREASGTDNRAHTSHLCASKRAGLLWVLARPSGENTIARKACKANPGLTFYEDALRELADQYSPESRGGAKAAFDCGEAGAALQRAQHKPLFKWVFKCSN